MWYNSLEDLNLQKNTWSWVSHSGSLTKYLDKQAGPEQLIIKLLSQNWQTPIQDQQQRLSINNSEIFERKIIMTVMSKPWLFARTYFNKQAYDYIGEDLSKLGSKSLGELIISNYPSVTRDNFQYALLDKTNILFNKIINWLDSNNISIDLDNNIIKNKLIVRRSLFYNSDNQTNTKNILFNIDEVFLPELINKMLKL